MKKMLLIIGVILFLSGCSVKNNDKNIRDELDNKPIEEDISIEENDTNRVAIEKEESLNDTINPRLLSTYNEGDRSWSIRDIHYPYDVESINKEILCSTKWSVNPPEDSIILVFYMDDVFKIGIEDSNVLITGNYAIVDNNRIKLSNIIYDKSEAYKDRIRNYIYFNQKDVIFSFEKEDDNHWYTDFIRSEDNSQIFYAMGSGLNENNNYVVDGYEVIKQKSTVITTANLKFREKPDIESKCIEHWIYEEYSMNYFKKDTYINVIGHTIEEFEVNGETNYWYYILEHGPDEEIYTGWVFGEYIESLVKFDEMYIRTEVDQISVKEEWAIDSKKIGLLKKNKEYIVLDIKLDDENNPRYYIVFNEKEEGWVGKQDCSIVVYDDNGFKDMHDNPIYKLVDSWMYFSSRSYVYRKPIDNMKFEKVYDYLASKDTLDYEVIHEDVILVFPTSNTQKDIILSNSSNGQNIVIDKNVNAIKIVDDHLKYTCDYDFDSIDISIDINDLLKGSMITQKQYPFNKASIFMYDNWVIYDNNIMYENTLEYCDEFYYFRYPEYKEPNLYIDTGYFVDPFKRLRNIGDEKKIIRSLSENVYQYDYSDKCIAYISEIDHCLFIFSRENGSKTRITDFKVSEVRVFNQDEIYYKVPGSDVLYCYKESKHSQVIDRDIGSYEVLGEFIYFIDKNYRLYRMKTNSKDIIEIANTHVGELTRLGDEIYYYSKYGKYNILFKVTNEDQKSRYVRLISEMDYIFSGKGNIYYYRSRTFTNLFAIKPTTGQLPGKVIYEDENYGVFTSYTGWSEILYSYNKKTDHMIPLFDDIHHTGSKVWNNWIYAIEDEDRALYRGNMETGEKQCIYKYAPNGMIFHVVDDNRVITFAHDTHTLNMYNISSSKEQVISNDCNETLFEYNNDFYYLTIDNKLMKVDLDTLSIKEELTDNVKLGQMYDVTSDWLYCKLIDVEDERLNDCIVYITTEDDLIKLDLGNGENIKIAENCDEIIDGMIEHFSYEYIYYLDKDRCLNRAKENSNEKISNSAIIPYEDRYGLFENYIFYMMPTDQEMCVEYIKYNAVTGDSEVVAETNRLVTDIVVKEGVLYYNYHRGGSW